MDRHRQDRRVNDEPHAQRLRDSLDRMNRRVRDGKLAEDDRALAEAEAEAAKETLAVQEIHQNKGRPKRSRG